MTSEIDNIMSYFYQKYKGEKSFKILMRLREYFVGIPRDRKQCFINRNKGHCPKHPIFSNKEGHKPIIANGKISDRFSFRKAFKRWKWKYIYKYVLSCLDVCSRYIMIEIKRHNWRSYSTKVDIYDIWQSTNSSMWQGFGILRYITPYLLHLLTGQ